MTITDKLIERVKKHEGFRDKPYFDTVGKVTVGYGRNMEDNPLTVNEVRMLFNRVNWKSKKDSEDWAERLMRADLEKVSEELNATLAMWPQCSKDQQTVLIDLGFNIGIAGLMTFKGMLEAIDNEEPTIAAYELLNSRYARQTKTRAIDNARLLAETNQNFDNAVAMLETNQIQTYKAVKEYI